MRRALPPGPGSRADHRTVVESLGSAGRAFFGRFKQLREVQRLAMPRILRGENLLLASATASGKTEAVVAPIIARATATGSRANGTRVLVVAPTRALVNDLYRRVEPPLDRLDLSCGRQTSDRRDKSKRPFMLITTPESFDSMLVRDGVWNGARLVSHLLAQVDAVFIDEAHLFDGNPRGDQLPWLLGRLRRLRELRSAKGPPARTGLQVCAATATVSDPKSLAVRLLGHGAGVARASGVREIEILGPSPNAKWLPLSPSLNLDAIRRSLEIVPARDFPASAGARLASALFDGHDGTLRKALVFVPTRKLADTLAADWEAPLGRRRELKVLAHHGSLSRPRREGAEQKFLKSPDAVLVATTTMEVGVDIGDVDLVALVGAPPGTRALLQRIGRGGRRIGRTRLLALPRNVIEQAALASMLAAARDGQLELESYARRWSVFVQQTASFVAQQRVRGRRRRDLLDLARDVWPEEPPLTAEIITNALVDDEHLREGQGRLSLGDRWADRFETRGMHANIGSEAPGVPVVNASTGEEIARVRQAPAHERGLALGGQTWNVQEVLRDEIRLQPHRTDHAQGGFEYAIRRGPIGREYGVHVSRGLGFRGVDAPLLVRTGGAVWFHFGGSAWELLLRSLTGELSSMALGGLALRGVPDLQALQELACAQRLTGTVRNRLVEFEGLLDPGPYQRLLPVRAREQVVADLLDIDEFRRWLESRNVWRLTHEDPRRRWVETALRNR